MTAKCAKVRKKTEELEFTVLFDRGKQVPITAVIARSMAETSHATWQSPGAMFISAAIFGKSEQEIAPQAFPTVTTSAFQASSQ